MAGLKISPGSNSHGFTKADRQVRRGYDRTRRDKQSVECGGNRYQSRRVSPASGTVCRTADKYQGNGRKRTYQSSFSSSSAPSKRFHHDGECFSDAHDRAGELNQIKGGNRFAVIDYIEGRREANKVIALTITLIPRSPSFDYALELITNVYHPLIPEDKFTRLQKDPGPVNAFLNKLLEHSEDSKDRVQVTELFGFAKRALELLVSRGVTCNILTHNYLMKIHDKVSDIDGAKCLLKRDNLVSGNPEDWFGGDYHIGIITEYLKLCLQTERYQEAGKVIDALIKVTDHAALPLFEFDLKNSSLVVAILSYCTAVGDFELAQKIINPGNDYCLKWRALHDKYSYNAFLNLCIELGKYKEAKFIIDLLILNAQYHDKRVVPELLPDNITVATMLKYCIHLGNYDLARRLIFGTLKQPSYISTWNIKPDAIIYNTYMRMCLTTGQTQDIGFVIGELHRYAQDKNSDPSQRPIQDSCFVILEYCLETKNLGLAKELLLGADGKDSLIRQWNIPYPIYFFNNYLRMCTKAGEYQQAEQAINEFINREKYALYKDLHPDPYTPSAIFEFCKAAGNVDLVKKIVFSGKAAPGCVDLRDVKIISVCLSHYITTCVELRMFQQAGEIIDSIIKSAERRRPYLNVPPDVIIVVAILKYCVRADDTDLADLMVFGNDKQQSYLSKWEIEPNYNVYAQWALVDKQHFAQALDKLVKNQICVNKLGYSDGVFDTHIDQVFKNKYCVDDNGKKFHRLPGLPSEFAEALFEYHYRGRGRNIKQVITGYHGTGALSEKFTDVLQTKFKLEIEVSPDGGCIVIKKTESETMKPED